MERPVECSKPAHHDCNDLLKQIDDLKAQLVKAEASARSKALDDAWAAVQTNWPLEMPTSGIRPICDAILDLKTRKMP